MRDRFVHVLATGFGVGHFPVAPGTAGSLLGLLYWWWLSRNGPIFYWAVFALGVVFAVWCAGTAAERLHRPDPNCVVIDEIAAIPLALAGVAAHPWWAIPIGFLWFRLFDIWKPAPIRQSQALTGGLGIVADDLLAALYSCAATHIVLALIEWAMR